MSDFMESEFVQEGLDNIQRLQHEIYADIMEYDDFDYEDKMNHLNKMSELVNAQEIMYARMSLSDDPSAVERKEAIQNFVDLMGFGHGTDVRAVFTELHQYIDEMKKELDARS